MNRSLWQRSTHQTVTAVKSTVHRASRAQVAGKRPRKSRLLDEAYDEYCRLQTTNGSLTASQFCERYPTLRRSLRRLIEVHDVLANVQDEESWPQPGDSFLGFEILELLGVGATARVYLAAELRLGGRLVAVKVSHFGGDEARTLGKLSHPHVVPIHSVQEDSLTGMTAICMPYLGSVTLSDMIDYLHQDNEPPRTAGALLDAIEACEFVEDFCIRRRRERPPDPVFSSATFAAAVLMLGRQLAGALSYTHDRGVLHRDLKPSNVLVTPEGQATLLDFNLSCDGKFDTTRWGGTLPYMPPEQLGEVFDSQRTPAPDPRSDFFSLGVILYELWTGKLPFPEPIDDLSPSAAAEHFLEAQRAASPVVGEPRFEGQPELAAIITACLSLDLEKRPADAEALAARLDAIVPRQQRPPWKRRAFLRRAAFSGGAAVVALATFVSSRPPYPQRMTRRGIAALRQREFRPAASAFTRVVEADPTSAIPRLARGVAWLFAGEYELANRDLRAVEEEWRDDAALYDALGYAAFASGNPKAAAHWYRQAIALAPQQEHLRVGRAFAMMRAQGPSPAAILPELQALLQIQPDSQAAFHLRARLNMQLMDAGRQPRNAPQDDLARALQLGGSYPLLELDMARAFALQAGDHPEIDARMIERLRRAIENGLPSEILDNQPWLQTRRGEPWYRELRQLPEGPRTGADADERFVRPPKLEDLMAAIQRLQSLAEAIQIRQK